MIDPAQRIFLAIFVLAAIGSGVTTGAKPETEKHSARSQTVRPERTSRFVSLRAAIRRDPFAGAPRPQASRGVPEQPVPDPPSDWIEPEQQGSAYALKATIAGETTVAYVAAGSTMRLVRAGDFLGSLRVAAIDARGLVLSDGTRLDLAPLYAPTAAPRSPAARRVQKLRPKLDPPIAPNASAREAATPETTAGPLPTPRAGAYPLGNRPTSDPAAPTAFPYPYPYAPR